MVTQRLDSKSAKCVAPRPDLAPPSDTVCGDYAVNTVQPMYQPFAPGAPANKRLPPLPGTHKTIGDELDASGIGWAWYSGGWDNATGNVAGRGWTNGRRNTCGDKHTLKGARYPNCPDALFQFHHQPFNYFERFGPGTVGREHLKDEQDFFADLHAGRLPAVAFVKPVGAENEHPGYTDLVGGERHLVALIDAIQADAADWPTTAIVITYDENGGA